MPSRISSTKNHHGSFQKDLARAFPQALEISPDYRGSGKLEGKIALVTSGENGIGRAAALHFAREGADIAIVQADGDEAAMTCALIEAEGRRCLILEGDVSERRFCTACVKRTVQEFDRLDILANIGAVHSGLSADGEGDVSETLLEHAFRSNVYAMFFLTQAALPHLERARDACVINCIINAIAPFTGAMSERSSHERTEYAAAKGAMISVTRSLAEQLASRGVRVNAIVPGPIWTLDLPLTMTPQELPEFGRATLLGRPGHPSEVGPAFVFLASQDASYITGQVIQPNGGQSENF